MLNSSMLLTLLLTSSSSVVDPVRISLEAAAEKWFMRLVVSSWIVAAGCLLESPEVFNGLRRWWRAVKDLPPLEENPKSWLVPLEALGLIFVIAGVTGEVLFEEFVSKAETALRAHDEQSLAVALEQAGEAKDSAGSAAQAACTADKTASHAERRLTGALQQALRIQRKLDRLRSPRSIQDTHGLVSTLEQYKGTQYRLNVFGDEESISLMRKVDGILVQAGWVRKQPETSDPGTPSLAELFPQEKNSLVPTCVEAGVRIWVRSTFSQDEMSRPLNQSHKEIQAAKAFVRAFASRMYPQDGRKVARQIGRNTTEGPMIICIGKKP